MYTKIFRSKNVYDIEKSINNLELVLLQNDKLLQFFSLCFSDSKGTGSKKRISW